ncbi:replication initiation by nicking [Bacillus phage vB_BcoS-136]|uniref:Replication-relaxation n=1 Tax=Bacillus phage vB_BcoS-136 TaxID=2419619 RepID=A0A3G3BVQ3_9CAUD|nr:replication initiation by nicking [Bacillus phage vB_BcoS-136]AYP68231.1 hypothetical protein vBBcoS136_00099 [Bacillus phage vB_BcoS-136]
MKNRSGWYSRKEIQKVTLDWLKTNCRLTEREREILRIVQERKLVRRDHLEIICPSYRDLNSRTRLINRAIRKLFNKMCLDKVHEEQKVGKGNTPCIVSLDRGGSLLLNVPHKKRISHEKKTIKGIDYIFRHLPTNFRHINGVNQLEVDTILFCEETGSEMLEWVHEKPVKMVYRGETKTLIPDISMCLRFNTEPSKPFYAFLEFDTGSENIRYKEPPIIRDKIIKYKIYKLSKLWTDYYPYFPTLLFVTEDEGRINFFNNKCKENGIAGVGIYHENYTKALHKIATML